MTFLRNRIDPLLVTIEQQRLVVDAGLTRPASWRGPIRREFSRSAGAEDRAPFAAAFDGLVAKAASGNIDVTPELLLDLHGRCLENGGAYRSREVKVGPFLTTAPFRDVGRLVEMAFDRAHDGVEPPLLAAARLNLELFLIHPFGDGNGRAIRLLVSAMLLNAGYKSDSSKRKPTSTAEVPPMPTSEAVVADAMAPRPPRPGTPRQAADSSGCSDPCYRDHRKSDNRRWNINGRARSAAGDDGAGNHDRNNPRCVRLADDVIAA